MPDKNLTWLLLAKIYLKFKQLLTALNPLALEHFAYFYHDLGKVKKRRDRWLNDDRKFNPHNKWANFKQPKHLKRD